MFQPKRLEKKKRDRCAMSPMIIYRQDEVESRLRLSTLCDMNPIINETSTLLDRQLCIHLSPCRMMVSLSILLIVCGPALPSSLSDREAIVIEYAPGNREV